MTGLTWNTFQQPHGRVTGCLSSHASWLCQAVAAVLPQVMATLAVSSEQAVLTEIMGTLARVG